jgi:serine/threonine-protein kinase
LHRDIKPENLFMTKQGELKVLDFGIARLADSELTVSATEVGTLLGTPAFLPPEQARGLVNSIDARTDLWAVGATMFTLLTGRFVHEASTPNEQLGLAMTASARSLSEVQPASPAALASIVDRALAYAQSNRWKDARAMQDAVRWAREHWDEIAKTPETVPAEWGAVAPARPQMDTLGDEPPFPSLHRDEEPVSSTHAEVNRQRPGIVAKVAAALIILGGVVAYWSAGQPVRPPESQVSSAARVAMAMGAPKQPAPTIPGTAEKAPQQAAIMPPTPSVAPSTAAPAPSPVPRSTRTPDRVRAPAALGSQRVVGTAQLPSPSSTPAGPEPGSRDLYDRRL